MFYKINSVLFIRDKETADSDPFIIKIITTASDDFEEYMFSNAFSSHSSWTAKAWTAKWHPMVWLKSFKIPQKICW